MCNLFYVTGLYIVGITVSIHSPKKALPSTYLPTNKYHQSFFCRIKRLQGVFIYQ